MAVLCPSASTLPTVRSVPPGEASVPRSAPAASPVLFVDNVHGSDTAAGSKQAPLRTLERALAISRTLPGRPQTPVSILLRGAPGSPYTVSQPLELGPADSGLTLGSYDGQATLTGARTVTPNWTQVTLPGRNASLKVFTAHVPGNFTTLSVAGKRQILARHPNADPETAIYPAGANVAATTWAMPVGAPAVDKRVVITSPNRTEWVNTFGRSKSGGSMSAFYEYVDGGSANRFTPPICPGPGRSCCSNNFPYCGTPGTVAFNISEALGTQVAANFLRNHTVDGDVWTAPKLMAVHAFWVKPVWYNLIFRVGQATVDQDMLSLRFDGGGHQSSQGAEYLNDWWMEGDLGLLDADGEWFHDGETLWYAVNGSDTGVPPAEIALSEHQSLIMVSGTSADPVTDVSVENLGITGTATTHFEPHEALGGGDQALHRGGAVFAEGVVRFAVRGSTFVDVGGNGVVISGYSRDSTITNSTFVRFGAAAMAVAGRTELIDATGPDHPINTTISHNVARDGGVYLKGYYGPLLLAKQQSSHVYGNIFFNCPRSAITLNDGAMGGDVIEGNLMFNANRETQDTGVIYTYDRLVFKFLDDQGATTVVPRRRIIRGNMLFGNYQTVWPIDHDDGTKHGDASMGREGPGPFRPPSCDSGRTS